MANLIQLAGRMRPDLKGVVIDMQTLSGAHRISQVFYDVIDYMYYSHFLLAYKGFPTLQSIISKYKEEKKPLFEKIKNDIYRISRKKTGIMDGVKTGTWDDPLGGLYEILTQAGHSKNLGQFFTPSCLCDFLAELTPPSSGTLIEPTSGKPVSLASDPCSGSGRMMLAAAAKARRDDVALLPVCNDIDPICTKMTAINFAINQVIGEANCSNGLDWSNETWSFGVKTMPAAMLWHEDKSVQMALRLHRAAVDAESWKNMFVFVPMNKSQSFWCHSNLRLLNEADERKKQAEIEKRKKSVEGTLFAGVFQDEGLKQIEKKKGSRKKDTNKRMHEGVPDFPSKSTRQTSLF